MEHNSFVGSWVEGEWGDNEGVGVQIGDTNGENCKYKLHVNGASYKYTRRTRQIRTGEHWKSEMLANVKVQLWLDTGENSVALSSQIQMPMK